MNLKLNPDLEQAFQDVLGIEAKKKALIDQLYMRREECNIALAKLGWVDPKTDSHPAKPAAPEAAAGRGPGRPPGAPNKPKAPGAKPAPAASPAAAKPEPATPLLDALKTGPVAVEMALPAPDPNVELVAGLVAKKTAAAPAVDPVIPFKVTDFEAPVRKDETEEQRREALNLCPECGEDPIEEGKDLCHACHIVNNHVRRPPAQTEEEDQPL